MLQERRDAGNVAGHLDAGHGENPIFHAQKKSNVMGMLWAFYGNFMGFFMGFYGISCEFDGNPMVIGYAGDFMAFEVWGLSFGCRNRFQSVPPLIVHIHVFSHLRNNYLTVNHTWKTDGQHGLGTM